MVIIAQEKYWPEDSDAPCMLASHPPNLSLFGRSLCILNEDAYEPLDAKWLQVPAPNNNINNNNVVHFLNTHRGVLDCVTRG